MSGESVAIDVRDLHKSFRIPNPQPRGLRSRLLHPVEVNRSHELHVLRGISFAVRQGEFFGIVGRNGSGKSTLLRILSSIDRVDRGTVRVAGRIGPLIELGVGFDPQLSARENVVLNGVMLGLSPRELRRRADSVLEFAEVEDFGDVPLKNFSSGMRVRLAFASLVQADPEILLVDEILAVGDAGFREKCTNTFLELKASGKTIVFVTHAMNEVQRYCDRAMLLESGEIAEFGDPKLVTRRYYEVTLQHRRTETDIVHATAGQAAAADAETRARITDLRLNGTNGLPQAEVEEGTPIELEAWVSAERPIRATGLRLEIRTENGARVFAPPDPSVSGKADDLEPGQTIRASATIENRLSPGRYAVACTVLRAEGSRTIPASPARTLEFTVTGDRRGGRGLVSLQHEVHLERGEPPSESRLETRSAAQEPPRPVAGQDTAAGAAPGSSSPAWTNWLEVALAWLRGDWFQAVLGRLRSAALSPVFAYGSILIIQLELLWGIWAHRDLTPGDTSAYFRHAASWADSLELSAFGVPLYQAFWGSIQWFIGDLYAHTITQRVLIVLAASLLVLAVLRRLLTPGIAWLLALWWVLLPVNYDVTTEAHLFAVLPLLGIVLLASSWSGLAMRSTVFGLLLLCTILVRQEYIVSVLVWLAAWIMFELWLRRSGRPLPEPRRLAVAFGAPVLALVVVIGALGLLDPSRTSPWSELQTRSGVLTCGWYAQGYADRHDDFKRPAVRDCEILARRDLGEPRPSFVEAFAANPGAMIEHVGWNLHLTPYGLQHLMLGATSGSAEDNPDVVGSGSSGPTGSALALLGSLLLVGIVATGTVLVWRDRRRWWETWIWPRTAGWFALIAIAAAAIPICILIRPRAEYLYPLSVLILSVVGLSAMAIAARWPWLNRLLPAIPVIAVVALIATPARYDGDYITPQSGEDRPLLRAVSRLEPYADSIRGRQTRFAVSDFRGQLCDYVGASDHCDPVDLSELVDSKPPDASPAQWLAREGIDVIYVDEDAAGELVNASFLRGLEGAGWERLAPADPDEGWILLRRATPEGGEEAAVTR